MCQEANLVLAVSEFAKNEIESKYLIKDIHLVYNGIPKINKNILTKTHADKVTKKKKINVFWVGKNTYMKGFDILIDIIKSAPSDFYFILNIGHSIDEVPLSGITTNNFTIVQDLSKEDQLELLSRCQIFLSTSKTEGFGIAVIEALNLGIPAILNKNCKVFKEFESLHLVHLVDLSDKTNLWDLFRNISSKRGDINDIPKEFTQDEMVNKSIKFYNSIL